LPHHRHWLRRSDVVTGRPLDLVGNIEVFCDIFFSTGQPESAAHGDGLYRNLNWLETRLPAPMRRIADIQKG
jgi:hypothetical protein